MHMQITEEGQISSRHGRRHSLSSDVMCKPGAREKAGRPELGRYSREEGSRDNSLTSYMSDAVIKHHSQKQLIERMMF